MPLTSLITIFTRKVLGVVQINDRDGSGIDFDDAGDYYLSAPVAWFYHADDGTAIASMTAVAAGEEVHLEGPVAYYMKCRPGVRAQVKVEYVPLTSGDPTAEIDAAVLAERGRIASRSVDLTRPSTTLVADSDLNQPLVTGVKYEIDLFLDFHQPANDQAFQWQCTFPAASGFRSSIYYDADSGATRHFYEDLAAVEETTVKANVASAVGKGFVRERLVLIPTASDNFKVWWANQSGGGVTGPTLMKGSHSVSRVYRV
jgi:hypothetical protein